MLKEVKFERGHLVTRNYRTPPGVQYQIFQNKVFRATLVISAIDDQLEGILTETLPELEGKWVYTISTVARKLLSDDSFVAPPLRATRDWIFIQRGQAVLLDLA